MVVYKITNLINGKIYIGQSHVDNENYYGSGLAINGAIKKYGKQNFKREILEYCDFAIQLIGQEIYWIKKLSSKSPNGYNLTDRGEGASGYKHTDEQRKRNSESHKGNLLSEENKRKIRESCKGMNKGKAPWNKGLTKETDARVKENAINIKKTHWCRGKTAKTDERVAMRTEKMRITRYQKGEIR